MAVLLVVGQFYALCIVCYRARFFDDLGNCLWRDEEECWILGHKLADQPGTSYAVISRHFTGNPFHHISHIVDYLRPQNIYADKPNQRSCSTARCAEIDS